EFCDGLLNHGLRRPVHIQLVVLDAVDVESVETWASSANRTSGAEDTTLLRRCSRSENCQFLYVAAQSIEGQVGNDFAAKRGLQFRRLGIDEIGAGFHLDHGRYRSQFHNDLCVSDLIRRNGYALLDCLFETVLFDRDGVRANKNVWKDIRSRAG